MTASSRLISNLTLVIIKFYKNTDFETHIHYTGYFFSGDGAHRDGHGFYRITGRMDDVINVSGHRLGTAEIEDALVSHLDHGLPDFILSYLIRMVTQM